MKNLLKITVLFIILTFSESLLAQKFKPVTDIPEGKALVYIYRPGRMLGAALHYTVNANEEKVSVAHLKNNTYLTFFPEPGKYTIWAQIYERMEIDIEVEAGKTYYVRGNTYGFQIPPIEQALKEIVKTKFSKPKI